MLGRPAACLGCSFVGCLSSTHGNGPHILEHGRKLSHTFCKYFFYLPTETTSLRVAFCIVRETAVDSLSGAVHCAECADFVTSAVLRKEKRLIKIQEETRVLSQRQGTSLLLQVKCAEVLVADRSCA